MSKNLDNDSDLSILIREYIFAATKHGFFTLKREFKRGNIYANKMYEIEKILKNRPDDAKKLIDATMENADPSVVHWGCGYAINLGYRMKEAKEKLERQASDKTLDFIGFSAEMILKTQAEKLRDL